MGYQPNEIISEDYFFMPHPVGLRLFSDASISKMIMVPRQLVYGHFVYDTSSTDISSTDISSTRPTIPENSTVIHPISVSANHYFFIDSNFYLHYDSLISIPLPLTL